MLAFLLHCTFLDGKRLPRFCFSFLCSLCLLRFRLSLLEDFGKCPECYGDDLCPAFRSGQIRLTWWSSLLWIVNPSWTKSVFYGELDGRVVVIKRKARRLGRDGLSGDQVENVVLCPSVVGLDFLFERIEGIERKKLWLDINSSIEPLLLMYLGGDGTWPVSQYKGACGDVIVEEYKGEPLANLQFSPLRKRISLAIELLKLANLFTFGHPHLAFYFTDYSLDNLVVDSNGNVFLVDLDNVIISNRSHFSDDGSHKRSAHTSEVMHEYEYAFSPSDICNHYLSDHNFFSVCKYLLTHPKDGLLGDISKETSNQELLELLNECSEANRTGDRFSAGQKLQFVLERIIGEGS